MGATDAARMLRDAADGDGGACRWLRRLAVELLDSHRPVHIGTLTTAALTGWRDGAWPERLVEAATDTVHAGSWRTAPLAPGVPVELATGQGEPVMALTAASLPEPDPDADQPWATDPGDDRLEGTTHQVLVPDLDAVPAGWTVSDRARLRLVSNHHLDDCWHLRYRAALDGRSDRRRYAEWLCTPTRAPLRGDLPAEPDHLDALLGACARRLGDYPAQLAWWNDWVMRRDQLERLLAGDRLDRYDLDRWSDELIRVDPGVAATRTCSLHLDDFLARRRDPQQLRRGLAWPATVFVANHHLAERLAGGPAVWRPRGPRATPVHVACESEFGLAGRWRVTGLSEPRAAELVATHRDSLGEPSASHTDTVDPGVPCEIERVLTAEEFSAGTLAIREQLDANHHDGRIVVDVRADASLAARVGADVACRGVCTDASANDATIHWPAPMAPGTWLRGEAQRIPNGDWIVRLVAYPGQGASR